MSTACPRCQTGYEAALVRWACPVCALPTPGEHPRRRFAAGDAGDRTLLIVGIATIGNILLLAVLTIAVLKIS